MNNRKKRSETESRIEKKKSFFDKESYLHLSLASQLKFVAKIEVPQDLYGALVDMDSVGCVQKTIR